MQEEKYVPLVNLPDHVDYDCKLSAMSGRRTTSAGHWRRIDTVIHLAALHKRQHYLPSDRREATEEINYDGTERCPLLQRFHPPIYGPTTSVYGPLAGEKRE